MEKFLSINFDTRSAILFDWALSFISIAVGVYYNWPLWIIAGLLGAVASWYRPLTKIQNMARNIVIKKTRS